MAAVLMATRCYLQLGADCIEVNRKPPSTPLRKCTVSQFSPQEVRVQIDNATFCDVSCSQFGILASSRQITWTELQPQDLPLVSIHLMTRMSKGI